MRPKKLPGMGKLTYHQRLSILKLDSLELRRVLADFIFTYKLAFGLIDELIFRTTLQRI